MDATTSSKSPPLRQLIPIPSSGATFNRTTGECTFLPAAARAPQSVQALLERLEDPVGSYVDPFTDSPITIFQFLSIWTKFAPVDYHTSYFVQSEVDQSWSLEPELLGTIRFALVVLQSVVSEIIMLVGDEARPFYIEQNNKYSTSLGGSPAIESIRMSDRLLKLRVEITFARLSKLKKLHDGMILNSPMASPLPSTPASPELIAQLEKTWKDPRLLFSGASRRGLKVGWSAILDEVNNGNAVSRTSRHPFTGRYAVQMTEKDVQLEDELGILPPPRRDGEPYSMGLYLHNDDRYVAIPRENSASSWERPPRAGPGSILPSPSLPTPPPELLSAMSSAAFRASSVDLDPGDEFQDVSFLEEAAQAIEPASSRPPRTPAPPVLASGISTIAQRVSMLGENLRSAFGAARTSEARNARATATSLFQVDRTPSRSNVGLGLRYGEWTDETPH
jgi:hypothetical protein